MMNMNRSDIEYTPIVKKWTSWEADFSLKDSSKTQLLWTDPYKEELTQELVTEDLQFPKALD